MAQQNQSNRTPRKTNWLFILIVILAGALAGLGIFACQYFQVREELQGQTTQIENLLHLIDKFKEKIEDLKASSPAETPALKFIG